MSGLSKQRPAWLLALALSAMSCGDDAVTLPGPEGDAGTPPDGQLMPDAGDRPDLDAATDAGVTPRLAACLDRPGALPSAPSGALPCALLPPGLTL